MKNIEIIISDNASNDGTSDRLVPYLSQDARIKYFRHTHNRGHYFNYDACRRLAMGRYFMWLTPGEELAPEILETYVSFMEAHHEYVTIMGRIHYMKEEELFFTERGFSLEQEDPIKRVLNFYQKVQQGTLLYGLHRNVWIRQNPVRPNLVGDWHFIAANAYAGKVKYLDMKAVEQSCEEGGFEGTPMKKVIKNQGLARFWTYIPQLRLALETFLAILEVFPIYRSIPFFKRLVFASKCAFLVRGSFPSMSSQGTLAKLLDKVVFFKLLLVRDNKEMRSKSA